MTFTQLTMSGWSAQLATAVGNAIAAAGNLSAADVRLADVRPFVSGGGRRRLLQASGVQAVYFARTADPDTVNTKLQISASDGSFARSLVAFGAPAGSQPSVALKSYYGREPGGRGPRAGRPPPPPPPPPPPRGGGGAGPPTAGRR
jgi:hypothetical protein